jgi:hypothetical protein
MKIIGKTGSNRLLLDASEDEVCQLTGYHSKWDRERAGRSMPAHGDELNVSAICKHAKKMEGIADELARARAQVDQCSANLLLSDIVIKKAIEKAEKAEEAFQS